MKNSVFYQLVEKNEAIEIPYEGIAKEVVGKSENFGTEPKRNRSQEKTILSKAMVSSEKCH